MESVIPWMGGKSRVSDKIIEMMPKHKCYCECVTPKTSIDMENGLLKQASDIKIGDKVLTHKGNYKSITKIFKRPYDGYLNVLWATYTTKPLITTSEHPILTFRRTLCPMNRLPKFTEAHNYCTYKSPRCGIKELTFEEATAIKVNDYLLYPIPNKFDIIKKENKEPTIFDFGNYNIEVETKQEINKKTPDFLQKDDFLELCGYYLAEGGISIEEGSFRHVHFSFHTEEKEYMGFVIKTMKKYFHCNYELINKKDTNSSYIRFYSVDACRYFNFFFGHGARNKFIHRVVMELPILKLTNLIRTYIYGDGYFGKVDEETISITSVSYNLINQIKILLNRLGMLPSYRYETPENINRRNEKYRKDKNKALFGLKITSNYGAHTLYVWGVDQCNKLFKLLNINMNYKQKHQHGFLYGEIDNNYMYMPIVKIEKYKYVGEVYNFEVEDDNSYVANGFCVHNCFAGGLSILFAKPQSRIEIVNDTNQELINFYKVLKNNIEEFKKREQYEMYSRQLYYEYLGDITNGKHYELPEVERALRFLYLLKNSINAHFGAGMKMGIAKNDASRFFRTFENIDKFTLRLKDVTIDNRDFAEVVTQCDSIDTLFLIDPPYVLAPVGEYYFKFYRNFNKSDKGKGYKLVQSKGFSLYDHQRLYDLLRSMKGKFILTIDDCQWIKDRYDNKPGKFWVYDNTFWYASKREYVKELIITNYDVSKCEKFVDKVEKPEKPEKIEKPNKVKKENNGEQDKSGSVLDFL